MDHSMDGEEMKLTPEEIEKLKALIKKTVLNPGQSTFSNAHGFSSLSPTDKDAIGQYPYQEPEQDEQGTLYGYKVLRKHCDHTSCDKLVSPSYVVMWDDFGELHADREPSEKHMHGIHCTKRLNHPELRKYYFDEGYVNGNLFGNKRCFLVRCALSGTVVETEQGFRAQHAQIVGVLIDGNWKSYQDYKKRAAGDSRRNPWQEETYRRRYIQGDWNLTDITDFDSHP